MVQDNSPRHVSAEAGTSQGKKKKSKLWSAVFVIAIIVLVGSLVALGVIAYSYFQGQQRYGEIAEKSDFDPNSLNGGIGSASVDWDALLAVNPDTVGWVYMPKTKINYPVVQGQDNTRYLTYDFDGNEGWLAEYGTVFLDYRNKKDFSDQVSFVYGHNMNDGSMFADIAKLTDQATFDDERDVYFLTPGGNFKLRTFSLVHCSAYDPIVETTFASQEDLAKYVQDKIDRSVTTVSDSPDPSKVAKVFAFATCDNYSSGRYVLFCYVVDTTAKGLSGMVGLQQSDGQTQGFSNGLSSEK